MISVNNLSYYIGDRVLYDEAKIFIKPKAKIGLIGYNGMGKSTFLHLLYGNIKPTEGQISMSKECTIGFLNQDLLSYQSDSSILYVVMEAFGTINTIQNKIDSIIHKMETQYDDKLVEQLTTLQEQFEVLGGYTAQSKAEEILEGIGFTTKDLTRPLHEFSGGWRMRVMLAKLLLEAPSLLLLDEPTNHLDLPSIEWLEKYMVSYNGASIIVSHDRDFINSTCTQTVEVMSGKLNLYEGNFDFYEKEKILREEIQKNAFQNQQKKIKQTERFIERFRAKATKSKQVQSRVKMLNKMRLIEDVIDTSRKIKIKFSFEQPSGKKVIAIENFSKKYGDNVILYNTNALINRGDKIALIGANGIGKSTLLRIISGNEPISGTRELGYNVNIAFYAQHQLEALNIEAEVLEELKQSGAKKTELELRECLGCFLFTGDDVFKKIKVLSGGEKSRVALAKVLVSEANFLLLDEPTNHLDMLSENLLIQAIQQYQGTVLMVSHNRHFVSNTANKIWYIENQQLREYPGTYDEYIDWNKKRTSNSTFLNNDKKTINKNKKITKKHKNTGVDFGQKEKLKKRITQLEKAIEKLEKDKIEIEKELYNEKNALNTEFLAEKSSLLEQTTTEISTLTQTWENAIEKLEDMG